MPTALITGITGQDGSYLAELLLDKGYRVVGMVRRSSTTAFERIAHILDRVEFVSADLLDQHSLVDAVREYQPDEIYNLAAQSFVGTSWTQPVLTGEFTGLGVTRMLEAAKKAAPNARFYQASSSEMFGGPAPSTRSASVTDMQWLQPTAANIAKALVTIPAGFRQVSSPADQ